MVGKEGMFVLGKTCLEMGSQMEKRIAILGIIVEEAERAMAVNDLLHEYREYIIGRMGMPYREKNISVISVVLDAPNETISALSGKLGMLDGVSSKAVYSKKLVSFFEGV